jgi:hypothetical protein
MWAKKYFFLKPFSLFLGPGPFGGHFFGGINYSSALNLNPATLSLIYGPLWGGPLLCGSGSRKHAPLAQRRLVNPTPATVSNTIASRPNFPRQASEAARAGIARQVSSFVRGKKTVLQAARKKNGYKNSSLHSCPRARSARGSSRT